MRILNLYMEPIINLGLLRSLVRSAKLLRVNKLASATIKISPSRVSLIKKFTNKITFLFSIEILKFFLNYKALFALSQFLRIIKFGLIIIKAQGIQISLTRVRSTAGQP